MPVKSRVAHLVVVAAALAGCATSTTVPHESAPVGSTASLEIGPEGGTIELGDARITIPAGALHESREITVSVSADATPSAFGMFSPVYHLEPADLVLNAPAVVTLPFDGRDEVATVFRRDERSAAYIAEAPEANGDIAVVSLSHLGSVFVGSGSSDGSVCRPATSELDVLLAVDNSGSMSEEQAALAAELPRLARVLATGDIDNDGVQDFPAAASIHWGNISTDLGAGIDGVPTCNGNGGDAALLSAGSRSDESCDATYAGLFDYEASASGADPDAFAHDVACVARAGSSGCGFEQHLEASLRALTPSSSAISFFGGTSGQEDVANAGLVRSDSVLAIINLTDEDDGSAQTAELFDPESATYAGDLNLRNYQYPEALQPVSRYVDGLAALRADAGRLVFATVAGVPADLVADPSTTDYAAILADERMQFEVSEPTEVQPTPSVVAACVSESGGRAFPARRLIETSQGLEARGANTIVQSICSDNLDAAVDAILARIAGSLAGSCE